MPQWAQPQPAPQPPPLGAAARGAGAAEASAPTEANIESSRIESTCPSGQAAGALASLIERRDSNVDSQVRQRYSYNGMGAIVAPHRAGLALAASDAPTSTTSGRFPHHHDATRGRA